MKTRMMVSISILHMVSISCQMLTDVLPSGGPNPSSFAAESDIGPCMCGWLLNSADHNDSPK